MELSSPRFKAAVVTIGFSFWFYVITLAAKLFSLESLIIFVICVTAITQIFAFKLSRGLDIFAIVNTKIFLGVLYILVVSIYGVLFKLLRIDLLRLKNQKGTYWLEWNI